MLDTHFITDIHDPRLNSFHQLKHEVAGKDYFVVEGAFLAEKAMADGISIEALLLEEKMLSRLNGIEHITCPIYVASRTQMGQVAGFDFHRGVLACLKRPAPLVLEQLPDQTSFIDFATY